MAVGELLSGHASYERNLKQVKNPYLPSWEYVPDGEPYVFGGRVYVYGSHDKFGGSVYCMGDYVCWSAEVNDLGSWRYEGVIYRKDQDPFNADLQGNLYAPDVAVGKDGRYYLYYVLSNRRNVAVTVCDTPAGQYRYLGYVRYPDGTMLGEKEGDEAQFDPGVLVEGDDVYLYTGFCARGDKSRHGAMVTVLESDMLTVKQSPVFVAPGCEYSAGTGFEGHEFFEAPSIRKLFGKYCFIYSSIKCHELCYALSDSPTSGFKYMGVIVSGCDMGITKGGKPAEKPLYYTANNHGSVVEIGESLYVFYHRHTNGTNYSRQGCLEKLSVEGDRILQAEITSCGSVAPLRGEGEYPAYIACNLFTPVECVYVPWSGWMDDRFPKITQECTGENPQSFIANMTDGATAGFKYFDLRGVKAVSVRVMGYANGRVLVRTAPEGEACAEINVHYANVWYDAQAEAHLPDGVHALYFTFEGTGTLSFASFRLIL
ncbi:MAG: family 43 glycosylhydrolase [Clostridia bacterium]|nr:family 43 glycosylhydrolase [Clostridia bacterium]